LKTQPLHGRLAVLISVLWMMSWGDHIAQADSSLASQPAPATPQVQVTDVRKFEPRGLSRAVGLNDTVGG
jgi:hypothetical protein